MKVFYDWKERHLWHLTLVRAVDVAVGRHSPAVHVPECS